MADFIIRIKDKNNALLKEVITPLPALDTAAQGTRLGIECRERGYKVQYVGNYHTKSTEQVDSTTPPPPTCPVGQHWDATLGRCVDDVVTPPPAGLIYDMNLNFDWVNGPTRITVDDPFGDTTKAGTKYIRMNASGDPRILVDRTNKVFTLEHDGDYGRAYFGVKNYNVRQTLDFMLPNVSDNLSLKTRNRHQYRQYLRENGLSDNVSDLLVQGGIGSSYHKTTVEQQIEVWHGNNTSSRDEPLSPALEANKWYSAEYSVIDVGNGEVKQTNKLNGKVVLERNVGLPSQFFKRADFDAFSEFWVRLNASGGGQVKFRNLKVYAL